jgi:hypothetical protein
LAILPEAPAIERLRANVTSYRHIPSRHPWANPKAIRVTFVNGLIKMRDVESGGFADAGADYHDHFSRLLFGSTRWIHRLKLLICSRTTIDR